MSQIPLQSGEKYRLFEFLENGEPVIHRWAKKVRLSVRARAALNNRFKKIQQTDFALAQGTLINGPIYRQVYKCVIHADIMLRPMLCRGPQKPDEEYTLLLGAIEKDMQLIPADAKEKAQDNRNLVFEYPTLRRRHEKIPISAR